MGEIADMMLDGTMCSGCGEWLHDGEDGPGYPGYCSSCAREMAQEHGGASKSGRGSNVSCPTCGKRVKPRGLRDHQRDVHGVAASETTSEQFLPF